MGRYQLYNDQKTGLTCVIFHCLVSKQSSPSSLIDSEMTQAFANKLTMYAICIYVTASGSVSVEVMGPADSFLQGHHLSRKRETQ